MARSVLGVRGLMQCLAALAGLLAALSPASGQDDGAGRCVEVKGALLSRTGGGWKALKAGENVPSGVELVALFEADLESANKAVAIKLLADVGDFGPLPVLDTSARLLLSKSADAAIALDHGVVVLTNQKENGAANVVVKIRGEDVHVTLKSPGTKIGIELYGRHSAGAGSLLKDEPTALAYMLVGKGEATIAAKGESKSLSAPPGPAMLHWDSVSRECEVITLEKFPPELIRDEKQKARFARMCAAAEAMAIKNPVAVAAGLVHDEDALTRRVGVTALAAIDDVPHLLAALNDAKHQDVREQAILVLRSWMGNSSGQLKALRVSMLKQKYTLPQMKITMQLLVGFSDEERARPVVYELLIHSLDNKNVGVRALAHWHLVRLAPAGRDIAFDAGASEEDRQTAIERWRKLIPPGELPPRLKDKKLKTAP